MNICSILLRVKQASSETSGVAISVYFLYTCIGLFIYIRTYCSRDSDHAIVHLGLNVSSSAHNCGCVVNGVNAMAAI